MSDQQVAVRPSPPASQPGVYPTPPTTQPSSKATSPGRPLDTDNYLMEGLEDAVPRKFVDNRSLSGAVKSLRKCDGGYIVFSLVSEDQLRKIERLRDEQYKCLRFMYLNDRQTLIVKMPKEVHEVATSQFSHILRKKAASVGPGLDDDLVDIRTTTYRGRLSSKEADSAFKPLSTRAGKGNWPTLVIEAGVSERIGKLQGDATWWLTNSGGNVNIVLLFAITEASQTILIEQWEMAPNTNLAAARTRSQDTTNIPTCTTSFQIPPLEPPPPPVNPLQSPADLSQTLIDSSQPVIDPTQPSADPPKPPATTEPLSLNFEKLFARKPAERSSEKDLVFTTSDFAQWARILWLSTQ